ncbi:hypothetical protein Q5O24_09100 [Eubacteriaceae bacterium ES3]|nr:hypothetical protein Q5O24_09100 [Eubacteriaceae bacterium ES3]
MAKRLNLKNPQEIRRTLNRVANMVINHQIDPKSANTIILACNSVLSSIRIDDQQKKIDELEKIVDQLSR